MCYGMEPSGEAEELNHMSGPLTNPTTYTADRQVVSLSSRQQLIAAPMHGYSVGGVVSRTALERLVALLKAEESLEPAAEEDEEFPFY